MESACFAQISAVPVLSAVPPRLTRIHPGVDRWKESALEVRCLGPPAGRQSPVRLAGLAPLFVGAIP